MVCIPPTPPVPSPATAPASRRPHPSGGQRLRPLVQLSPLLLVGTLSACSSRLGAPASATEEGERILSLWRVLFWSAAVVGFVVVALIAWCLVRYRSRPEAPEPPQLPGNIPLELAYTAAPLVLAAVLFAMSVTTERATARVTREPALGVEVTGFQWQWRFHYPSEGVTVLGTIERPPELVLPVGQRVRLLLRSADVVHSFYVPGFLTKRDLIPGQDNELELRPVRRGRYDANCAEFCGLDHARMNFSVRVVAHEEFTAWVAAARTGQPQ